MADDLVYHELQTSRLCAVHAINSLLQGPFFTEVELAEIARELDNQERQMMMESGVDNADYLRFMAEDSGNVADDGNYSLQVVRKALEVWGLSITPMNSPEMADAKANPLGEDCFICHMSSHWFAIRKIRGVWYNLNSLNKMPEPLSDFYLSLFLDTMQQEGYLIFVVRGKFEEPRPASWDDSGNWKRPASLGGRAAAGGGDEDPELAMAIAASLEGGGGQSSGQVLGGGGGQVLGSAVEDGDTSTDEDLRQAIALSMQAEEAPVVPAVELPEEPAPGVTVTQLTIRLPDGSPIERRFNFSDQVQVVYDFVAAQGVDMSKYILITTFPRTVPEKDTTLVKAGLTPGGVLTVADR